MSSLRYYSPRLSRGLRSLAMVCWAIVLCVGCGVHDPSSAINAANQGNAHAMLANRTERRTNTSPGSQESIELGRSNLRLAPYNNADFLFYSFHSGIKFKTFEGKNLRFLGSTNDQQEFMVNEGDSLHYYSVDSFEHTKSFAAKGCSEINDRNYSYCADGSENKVVIFDTEARAEHKKFDAPFKPDAVEFLGTVDNIDVLQLTKLGDRSFIVGIDGTETIRWERRIAPNAECGLTNQNRTIICSAEDFDSFLVDTFEPENGNHISSATSEGPIMSGSHGWISEHNGTAKYFDPHGRVIAERQVASPLSLDVFPWHMTTGAGRWVPDPELELELMVDSYITLHNSAPVPVFNNIPDTRDFRPVGSFEFGFTLPPKHRLVSMTHQGSMLLIQGGDRLIAKDMERNEDILNIENRDDNLIVIRRGWFATHGKDHDTETLTVFIPVRQSKG